MTLPLIAFFATLQAPVDVQALIDQAIADRQPKVVLPDGIVPLPKTLRIAGADGLTIEGPRTTLLFSDALTTGIKIDRCKKLTLRGFTVDYNPLPFVQATVMRRSNDGKRFDLEVCQGYPGFLEAHRPYYRQAYVFESTEPVRWKPGVPDLYPREVQFTEPRHGSLIFGGAPARHELIKVGDRIVLTVRAATTLRMDNTEDVRFEDLTFLAGPGGCVLGRYMRGEGYFRYTVKPGPPPAGATVPRMLSTCADAFNYAFATQGPTLERCDFSYMGDDSVNLHGATMVVLEQVSPTELRVGWPYAHESLATVMPPGGTVRRLAPDNFAILGTAPMASFVNDPAISEAELELVHKAWPRNQAGRGAAFRITLEQPLTVQPGEYVDVPESNSPDFAIRDSYFHDHRARGLRIMASSGTIERNRLERLKMNAITLGCEYGFWREAGWMSDVVVRGNTIHDVCNDAASNAANTHVLGAISVFCTLDRGVVKPHFNGHRNISIVYNEISECPTAGIYAFGVDGLTVTGNTLSRVMLNPAPDAGTRVGLDLKEAIDLRHAEHVTVSGNTVR